MLPAQSMFQFSKFLAKLTDLGMVTHIGKATGITFAKIVINVVTQRHIQKLLQMYLLRLTAFHMQTVMIETFCKKANAWR